MDDGQCDPYKETIFIWELLLSGNYFVVLQIKLKLRKNFNMIIILLIGLFSVN